MSPDVIGGLAFLAAAVLLWALLAPRRPRCARCGRKLPRAEAMAERYSVIDCPAGSKLVPLCLACFMGTFR